MNKTICISFSVAFLITGCAKEEVTEPIEQDIPVVEAYLEPNEPIRVSLSKMLPYTEEEYTSSLIIDTATVFLEHDGITYLLHSLPNEPGVYADTISLLEGVAGDTYSLKFNYNDEEVSAVTTIPTEPDGVTLNSSTLEVDPDVVGPGATLTPVTVSWNNPNNDYHIVMVEYMESSYQPINENLPEDSYDQFASSTTEPVVGGSYNLDTRRHLAFFGTYKIKVYKLNQEYVNLYENLNQSSLNLTQPTTNVVNGLGIFTGISHASLYLEVVEI